MKGRERRIRNYYEQLYANRSENLEEMSTCKLLTLKHEIIKILNRPITSAEIESVIKTLPTKESPEPAGSTTKFYRTFQEEFTPILHELFKTVEEEQSFQTLSVTPISH